MWFFFFFSSRRRHTRWPRDWSSDVCSSDLVSQHVRRIAQHGQRIEHAGDMLRDPSLEPRLHALAEFPLEQIISDKFDHGRERMRSGNKPGDDGPRPPQPRMFAQVNRFVWSSGERAGTRDDLAFETFKRGGAE